MMLPLLNFDEHLPGSSFVLTLSLEVQLVHTSFCIVPNLQLYFSLSYL